MKKPRMGRPPLPPQKRRESVVTLRLTKAERSQLEAEAEKAGLTMSKYLLKCWRDKKGD